MKRSLLTLLIVAMSIFAHAQGTDSIFFTSGKYYVVVGVLGIIFIGIIVYLVRMDIKLTQLEKREKS